MDDDHFQMHYNHVHADLTIASKKFHAVKIQRYVQLYQTPEMKKKIQDLGMDLLDYDACSSIWEKSWEDWVEFASSPEYRAALMPDADQFMDHKTSGIKVMAGLVLHQFQTVLILHCTKLLFRHELIAFGKAIPSCDSTDGILRD